MRTVIELRRPLGSIAIKEVKNAKSRDETSALLIGLQAIYKDKATRDELSALPTSTFFRTAASTPTDPGSINFLLLTQ